MKPKVIISTPALETAPSDLFISLDEAGRDWLVRELLSLDARHNHFHIRSEPNGELPSVVKQVVVSLAQ